MGQSTPCSETDGPRSSSGYPQPPSISTTTAEKQAQTSVTTMRGSPCLPVGARSLDCNNTLALWHDADDIPARSTW